jgi:sugar phosphate isomerase/epimerase
LDETARLDAVATIGVTIHASADFGARIVVVHPGVGTVESDERLARLRAATESLAALAGVAEGCDVRIAIENMTPGTVGGCADELAHMVDAVGAPHVGVCLDTGHAHLGEGVTRAISALGGRIIAMHLDDNDGQTDQHILPSKGAIDWAAAVAALREASYEAPICVETGRWEDLTVREMHEIVRGVLA